MAPDLFDDTAMRLALDQALNAWLVGEVPVGAVIVRAHRGRAAGGGHRLQPADHHHDPTAHAEIVALRHAAQLAENYRLPELRAVRDAGALRDVCDGAAARARQARGVRAPPIPRPAPRARWWTCSATARSTTTPSCWAACRRNRRRRCCASSSCSGAPSCAPSATPQRTGCDASTGRRSADPHRRSDRVAAACRRTAMSHDHSNDGSLIVVYTSAGVELRAPALQRARTRLKALGLRGAARSERQAAPPALRRHRRAARGDAPSRGRCRAVDRDGLPRRLRHDAAARRGGLETHRAQREARHALGRLQRHDGAADGPAGAHRRGELGRADGLRRLRPRRRRRRRRRHHARLLRRSDVGAAARGGLSHRGRLSTACMPRACCGAAT